MVKLMVVDDEVEICDFVKTFFQDRNFEVYTAYNGKEALALIEARDPDIILLDVRMPVMDGIQTLRELRSKKNGIKVIMVTAVEDSDKMQEAKKYGAVEYITKPLLLEQLEGTVMSLAHSVR